MNIVLYIHKNRLAFILILFLISYYLLFKIKPNFIFAKNGNFREFGPGYSKKTVLPIWLATILLSVVSYLAVQYFSLLNFPRKLK